MENIERTMEAIRSLTQLTRLPSVLRVLAWNVPRPAEEATLSHQVVWYKINSTVPYKFDPVTYYMFQETSILSRRQLLEKFCTY